MQVISISWRTEFLILLRLANCQCDQVYQKSICGYIRFCSDCFPLNVSVYPRNMWGISSMVSRGDHSRDNITGVGLHEMRVNDLHLDSFNLRPILEEHLWVLSMSIYILSFLPSVILAKWG